MSATEHKSIGDALVAFQSEVPTLAKDATNPHFRSKFTPLDTIVQTIRPLLAKHGLAWSALPCRDQQGEPALRYELRHAATGQVIGDTMPLLVTKADPQGMGSAITYARRYSLSAVLNLVSDEDDDGNSASRRQQTGSRPANGTAERPPLSDAAVEKVTAAIKNARMPHDWLRMQLIALGVENVPEGAIMRSTVLSMTEGQAAKLVALCDDIVASRAKAEARAK